MKQAENPRQTGVDGGENKVISKFSNQKEEL
jgi:hypothetical protein